MEEIQSHLQSGEQLRNALTFFIEEGLVGLLIESEYFPCILSTLDKRAPTVERRAALAWQVRERGSSLYLRKDGPHFLLENRDYLEAYILSGGKMNIAAYSGSQNQLSNVIIVPPRIKGKRRYSNCCSESIYTQLGIHSAYYPLKDYPVSSPGMRNYLVHSLRYDVILFVKEDLKILVPRTLELWKCAPPEARTILQPILSKMWKSIYRMVCELPISLAELAPILEVLPDDRVTHIVSKYGALFRCSGKTESYLAYLLAIPIHICAHDNEKMLQLLQQQLQRPESLVERMRNYHLSELRWMSQYCKGVRREICTEGSGTTSGPNFTHGDMCSSEEELEQLLANTTDSVNLEPITSYSPYDVVRYINSSGKIVQLVRCEYEYLVNNNKNPWTGEMLPSLVLQQLISRNNHARRNQFPRCKPLLEIITDVTNGASERESLTVAVLNVPGSIFLKAWKMSNAVKESEDGVFKRNEGEYFEHNHE